GWGLGLAIVRGGAHAHGGTVFTTPRPGGGTEVGFTVDASRLVPDPDGGTMPRRGTRERRALASSGVSGAGRPGTAAVAGWGGGRRDLAGADVEQDRLA